MKRFLIFIITVISLEGCHRLYVDEIKNETTLDIKLKIQFDTTSLHKKWGNRSYLNFVRIYPYPYYGETNDIKLIDFDSTNFTKTYLIKAGKTFWVNKAYFHVGFDDSFNMTLMGKDTIYISNKESFEKAFKRTERGLWQLIIK